MHINLRSWCMYTSRKIYNLELYRPTPWQTIWKLDTCFFFSPHGFQNRGDNLYLLPEAFYWWVLGTKLFPSRAYFGFAPGDITCHLLLVRRKQEQLSSRTIFQFCIGYCCLLYRKLKYLKIIHQFIHILWKSYATSSLKLPYKFFYSNIVFSGSINRKDLLFFI